MQKIIISLLAISIVACSDHKTGSEAKTDDAKATPASTTPANLYGYSPAYSSSFEMGDPKHSEMLLALWKAYDDGNLSAGKDNMSDSLHVYTADGSVMEGLRDSVLAKVQAYRDQFSAAKSTVHAIMPVRSVDKNQDWVLIWGMEVDTDKKSGKVDSVYLQETWRMKNGKFDLLYQHMRPAGPPKASK